MGTSLLNLLIKHLMRGTGTREMRNERLCGRALDLIEFAFSFGRFYREEFLAISKESGEDFLIIPLV